MDSGLRRNDGMGNMMRALLVVLALASSAPVAAEEIAFTDFARHAQFRDIKISPEGDYLAASAVVDGKAVLSLVKLDDMKGVNLRPRESGEVYEFWWVAPHRVVYTVAERVSTMETPSLTGELYGVVERLLRLERPAVRIERHGAEPFDEGTGMAGPAMLTR